MKKASNMGMGPNFVRNAFMDGAHLSHMIEKEKEDAMEALECFRADKQSYDAKIAKLNEIIQRVRSTTIEAAATRKELDFRELDEFIRELNEEKRPTPRHSGSSNEGAPILLAQTAVHSSQSAAQNVVLESDGIVGPIVPELEEIERTASVVDLKSPSVAAKLTLGR